MECTCCVFVCLNLFLQCLQWFECAEYIGETLFINMPWSKSRKITLVELVSYRRYCCNSNEGRTVRNSEPNKQWQLLVFLKFWELCQPTTVSCLSFLRMALLFQLSIKMFKSLAHYCSQPRVIRSFAAYHTMEKTTNYLIGWIKYLSSFTGFCTGKVLAFLTQVTKLKTQFQLLIVFNVNSIFIFV